MPGKSSSLLSSLLDIFWLPRNILVWFGNSLEIGVCLAPGAIVLAEDLANGYC